MDCLRILGLLSLTLLTMTTTLSQQAISRDNLCTRVENYTVTAKESYVEVINVDTYTMCLAVPPVCRSSRPELRRSYRIKPVSKSREITECCEGYKATIVDSEVTSLEGNAESVPTCQPICTNCYGGVCISPEKCRCIPGYKGDSCEEKCERGFWGENCKKECGCKNCDHITGKCPCPPGVMGPRCEQTCAVSRWGVDCANRCMCMVLPMCDPITGKCVFPWMSIPTTTISGTTNDDGDEMTARSFYPRMLPQDPTTTSATMIEEMENPVIPTTTEYIQENSYQEVVTDFATSESTKSTTFVSKRRTTEHEDIRKVLVSGPVKEPSTSPRSVIVLVSVPERTKSLERDPTKFVLHGDVAPTAPTPVSLDVALIVLGSILSLGFMLVAVIVVLYMRSKLFEAVRFSIYEDAKSKSVERESETTGKIPRTVTGSVLPQPPPVMNPLFSLIPKNETILTLDSIDPTNIYANGAATIGLRISGNLRDLLQEGHYDRPVATLLHLRTPSTIESSSEHLYDEIHSQSTL